MILPLYVIPGIIALLGAGLAWLPGPEQRVRAFGTRLFVAASLLAALGYIASAFRMQFEPQFIIGGLVAVYALSTAVLAKCVPTKGTLIGELIFALFGAAIIIAPVGLILSYEHLPVPEVIAFPQFMVATTFILGPFSVLCLLMLIGDMRFLAASPLRRRRQVIYRFRRRQVIGFFVLLQMLSVSLALAAGYSAGLAFYGCFIVLFAYLANRNNGKSHNPVSVLFEH